MSKGLKIFLGILIFIIIIAIIIFGIVTWFINSKLDKIEYVELPPEEIEINETVEENENMEEFRKCIGEIDMNDDIRKSIENDVEEYQKDSDLVLAYDREEHIQKLQKSYENEHIKNMEELKEYIILVFYFMKI